MEEYTLYLNYFNKTKEELAEHLDSVKSQTQKPKIVVACFLGTKNPDLFKTYLEYVAKHKLKNWYYTVSNYNYKYIGRYQLAINSPTDYIVMLDDDRYPHENYCKRMVESAKKHDAIMQQYGWILKKNKKGEWEDMCGSFITPLLLNQSAFLDTLAKGKSNVIDADYLCGGMVFHKKHLVHIFKEPLITDKTGEDIIFCLKAKAAGVKVLGYFPKILESDGSDWLAHRGGEVSSTLATNNVLKIKKIRSLLIQKYKQ
tara:strand:- start:15364 stop:16134 length:771 start_codon:yes stop_codon:yes gene_type:complete